MRNIAQEIYKGTLEVLPTSALEQKALFAKFSYFWSNQTKSARNVWLDQIQENWNVTATSNDDDTEYDLRYVCSSSYGDGNIQFLVFKVTDTSENSCFVAISGRYSSWEGDLWDLVNLQLVTPVPTAAFRFDVDMKVSCDSCDGWQHQYQQ